QITGVGTVREQTLRILPPQSITDPGLLRDYCKAYYDNLARHEGTTKFSTKFLTDLDGGNLIGIRPGDPVRVDFDAFVDEDLKQLSEQDRFSRMRELGYSTEVAQIVATEYDRIQQFKAPFYVKDVTLAWSIADGLSVEVEGINYVAPQRDD